MRWILRVIGVVTGAALLLVVGLLVAVPAERAAALLTERISEATGREVVISGEVRPTLWPSLGVRADGLRIGNPDWVDAGPLLQAGSLHVSLEWAALLRGEVRFEQAELREPEITLMRDADGRVSWDFAAQAGAGPRAEYDDGAPVARDAALPAIGFDRAEIVGGRLRWIDRITGRDVTVTDANGLASLPSATGPATLTASAEIEGAPLEIDMAIDGFASLLDGGVRPASVALAWNGGRAAFDGRLSLAPALEGTFDVDCTDFGPLLMLAGAQMPELPQGLGRERIAASGQITLTEGGTLHVRDGRVGLDGNAASVALDIAPGAERPFLRGTVTAEAWSVASTAGRGPATAAIATTASPAPGWPDAPIDVSGLFAADAEISLFLGSVDFGAAELGPVELNAALNRGRLVFDIGRIGVYGGRLAGQFVVNGRGGLSVGGDLILAGVQLNPLLSRFAGYDRLEGSGNASLQFLGVGNDVAAIMAGLQGEGDMAFGAGAILGLDLAGMIRNFDASYRGEGARTVYDSITANFSIADGIVANEDLRLEAPWGTVRGTGTVNLGARTLDYRVIPGLMRDESGQSGVEVPVLVSGPWSGLRFRPDLEYLAEQEFLEQRDRLAAEAEARLAAEQDRIEQEVRDRANELLGTSIEAGDGRAEIEGALRDRLGSEIDGVLSGLLGGGGRGQAGEAAGTETGQ